MLFNVWCVIELCEYQREKIFVWKNNTKESLDVKETRRIEKGVVLLLAGVVCGYAHVQCMMRVLLYS